MENEHLIEGLKSAIIRGETLQQAMSSLYNAGYEKEEIENAARALQRQSQSLVSNPRGNTPPIPFQPAPSNIPPQKISGYGQKPKSNLKRVIMIILLAILISILGLIFLFWSEVTTFLGKIT